MEYFKATNEHMDYIIGLFNPNNTEFMNSPSVSRRTLEIPGRADFIVSDNGEKIGWFNIRENGEFGMIIDKPFQGRGYGQKVLGMIEDEARKMGLKKLKLTVNSKNVPAIFIYEKARFNKVGELYKMEKDL